MEELHLHPIILPALISLFIMLLSITRLLFKPPANKNLPPSPLKLPIIGNLHQLGSLPHKNLHVLAKKHGPLMLLHYGSVPVLVVSSADTAREIMVTHDLNFANRPLPEVYKKLVYDCKDVGFSPYGKHWRLMKGILTLQLLSNKRVRSFRSIREEETAVLIKKIREFSGRPVNLSMMFSELNNNGISRSAFGKKYIESEKGKKFMLLMQELAKLLGSVSIGDCIPWLSWISRVNGLDQRVDEVAKMVDDFLEGVIQERLENRKGQAVFGKDGDNFADIMVEIYSDNSADVSIDKDSVKALILDVFVGGTDTVSAALEWTMAELLQHPKVMQKLQKEVRGIVKDKQDITNDDIEKMDYLKAVIKEALRRHPPLPLMLPREAAKDVKIKGYDVSAATVVMINAWAIGRDPESWDEAEKFKPERFLNSSIDFKGLNFEFIPFGAGRRGCPGITFAVATIELVLANLVHKFNWELPDDGKDFNMSESPGLSLHKAVPLLAIASKST